MLLAWFDHWVAGLADVPVPPAPTFTSFEGPPGVGAGWCELDGWDPTGTRPVIDLALGAPTARSPSTSRATTDGPVDAVTFTSAPLATDQVLVGHPSLTFRATLDAADAHFYVELLDVGRRTTTRRWSTTATSPPATGVSHTDPAAGRRSVRATEFRVAIRAHHHRFRAGHRVRVRVSGGAPSKLTPPPAPVTVTLETDGTVVLRLPGFTDDR